jgi:23S rRNA pseudouridine2605 synthase
VASRRKAEEMIEQGRVQVNGKVVTELGTKADGGRDHIRVDGKLLQGAERLRYFVLNKPRGFVTTVKDPEGRPTVMQFFDKMRERLYPVGRLDYMSEGLLLVTNDGDLAAKLTRASAGVEKTYLVKVAGIPTESELDILRAGVAIEKGKPGSGKVRTSPARIRQVRQGDNPWYEVVLIEGRNRELRKMFEEVGHFVEKIRRVGYGPLILDQEPGHLRELDAQELELLQKAADGKWKTPKAKEIRRRNIVDSLPPEKPAFKARGLKPAAGPKDYKPKKAFGVEKPERGGAGASRTGSGPAKSGTRPGKPEGGPGRPASGARRFGAGAANFTEAPRSFGEATPASGSAPRPGWKRDDRAGSSTGRPQARFAGSRQDDTRSAGKSFGGRPAAGRTFGAKPSFGAKPDSGNFGVKRGGLSDRGKPAAGASLPAKPAWKKPEVKQWPASKRSSAPKPEFKRRPNPEPVEDREPRKPFQLHIEPIQDSPRTERPASSRSTRPSSGYGAGGRSQGGREGAGRPSSARPFRSEGGLARPFTTSSGKPRAGGARPSSKPGGRTSGAPRGRGESRPAGDSRQRTEGFSSRGEGSRPERRAGTGWKPKPSFGGESRPRSGSGASRPKTGGSSKAGFKGKPGSGSPKRGGPKPGGKRPSGGRRP